MQSMILFVFLALGTAFAQDPVEAAPVEPVVAGEPAPAGAAPAPVIIVTDDVVVLEDTPPAGEVTPAVESVPGAPTTDAEALAMIKAFLDAFKEGKVSFGIGLTLTLLVYVVNRLALKDTLPQASVPYLAFGVGVAGAVGLGLVSGVPLASAILTGITAGLAAVAAWETMSKAITATTA
jgi:hypothetical protein